MAKYKLPNKYHEVVKDIADLRETLCAVETDIDALDEHRLTAERKVEKFSDEVVYSAIPFENSEIKNFAANKYLKIVNGEIEATEGGGNAGGIASQCLVKKFNEGKDCDWINLIEVEKDGIVHVGNNGDAGSNEAHVFSDLEDANFVGAPRSEVVNIQIKNNSLETQSNAAFLIKNEIEEIPEIAADTNPTEIASSNNYGLVQIGKNINVDDGEISIDDAPIATTEVAGIVQLSHGFEIEDDKLTCIAKREATFEKTGLIKPGDEFDFEYGTLVLKDMSDAKIIYKLGQFKVVKNGQIDLDEKCQIYRMHVTEDL